MVRSISSVLMGQSRNFISPRSYPIEYVLFITYIPILTVLIQPNFIQLNPDYIIQIIQYIYICRYRYIDKYCYTLIIKKQVTQNKNGQKLNIIIYKVNQFHNLRNNKSSILLQIDLKIQSDIHDKQEHQSIMNVLALLKMFQQQVLRFVQEIGSNLELQVYFRKARTNREEVHEGLGNICKFVHLCQSKIQQKNMKINRVIIKSAFTFIQDYLKQKDFSQLPNFNKAYTILDLESKANCCFQLLQGSLTLPIDITTMPKQLYPKVWKLVKAEVCGNQDKVNKGFQYLRRMLGITTSAVMREEQQSGAFTKVMAFAFSYPKYWLLSQEGMLKSLVFYRKPTIELAQKIWNLPQNGLIKQCAKLIMKSIKTNMKIYIPYSNQLDKLPQDICQYNPEAIQVRILHHQQILRKGSSQSSGCCGTYQKDIDTVILHMHGGGFVALSSRSMQTYTRKWAYQLKVPVFSVDYRKPPEYRFPVAIYDCLKVYSFIVNHISKYFKVFPSKIILAGDSAGGNLACSLMALILQYNLQIPHGILLAYPACDLRRIFSPSRIFAFNDPLLNPPMLMLCLKQYLNNKTQYQSHPLASPVLITQSFVSGVAGDERFPLKWPQTYIQVGAKDPLFDDSLRLLERMSSSDIKCQCQVYKNLSHGFLNLDFAIPQCQVTIKDSIFILRKMIEN